MVKYMKLNFNFFMRNKKMKPKIILFSLTITISCGIKESYIVHEDYNPEPNIPLECYTDTGILTLGKAVANPCYVCHTEANTPYMNEVEDFNLTLIYDFPKSIKTIGNPWLNAIKPELTIGNIPPPTDEEIKSWIRTDNWTSAFLNRGKGNLEYFPDVPPLYSYENGMYKLVNVDSEGFVKWKGKYTGWRVFKWKPFPGFFPTNGRIDSTLIRLPEKFRKKDGVFNIDIYKKNLSILECAIRGVKPGEPCTITEIGNFILPSNYEGGASDVKVIPYQYPPGTEFAHPIYYLDPANTYSFKSLRLREMRYMKKLSYTPLQENGEEEIEGEEFFWEKGRFFNVSGFWEMRAFIEDKNGNLRPQTPEESKFCIACHGGIGGTVDGTFTFWRKVPGSAGWKEQDYNLSEASIKDWGYEYLSCANISNVNLGDRIKSVLETYCNLNPDARFGEYQLYFSITNGGDHFRSNKEILSIISKDPNKISFVLSPNKNMLNDPNLINYLNEDGTIKPYLFIPSTERALGINKQYFRVVKSQAFKYGRDVFEKAFGISSGGNSLESLKEVDNTGILESGIWIYNKTLLE